MSDDLDLDLDKDDDGDDLDAPDATGQAAVLCRVDSLGVRFRFVATLDDALRLAEQQPCPVDGCLGSHMVVYGDDHGRLRIIADAAAVGEPVNRCNDALRVRERRRRMRARLGEAERQRRRRATKRAQLAGGNDDVDP